jgi:predicted DNA-binding transcriptional regulator AlpA
MHATDIFLNGPKVDARYGISPMTRWRWQRRPNLHFPKPININGRMVRVSEHDLAAFLALHKSA